jgi:homoserine dehydrogenase
MLEHDLIILKFGGSILRNKDSLDLVVEECHRAVHAGYSVIAVISAYHGMTDLLRDEVDSHHPHVDPAAVTSLLAMGEVLASGQAGVALLDAGLDTHIATVAEIGFMAEGDPLDADPIGLDTLAIRSILTRAQVLVVPGYMGIDTRGRMLLLGRGGSDLTAIHLACELEAASCSLIKDVDGLYVSDPKLENRRPVRYRCITYPDACRLDDHVIQPKALALAEQRGLAFSVRSSPTSGGTLVGATSSAIENVRPAHRAEGSGG